jgi:hypothetical protein
MNMEYTYEFNTVLKEITIGEYNSSELYSASNTFSFDQFLSHTMPYSFRIIASTVSDHCLRYLIKETTILDDLDTLLEKG